ncbi:MAG: hypothetical protein KTR17_00820 [Cellvibrionaceae bacterium]|nr:hypothetical protein [Cellvibrionaceae bacterium]
MRYFLIIFVAVLAVGCTAPSLKIDVPNLAESSFLLVEDLRPPTEKENKAFSYSITSGAYGIYRRGDKLIDPSPVRLLQHEIYKKYASESSFPKVKVHHLVVYNNLKSALRKSATGGILGGVVGALIVAGNQKHGIDVVANLTTEEEFNSFEKEYQRALYTQEQNPNKVSVNKVYLEAELDGKRTFIMTMTPVELPKEVDKNSHVSAIETAIAYFLDQY